MVTHEVLLAVVSHQLRARLEVLDVRRRQQDDRILLRRTEDAVLVRVLLVADEFFLVEDALLAELADGMRVRSVVETGVLDSVVQVTVVLLDLTPNPKQHLRRIALHFVREYLQSLQTQVAENQLVRCRNVVLQVLRSLKLWILLLRVL